MSYVFFDQVLEELGHRLNYEAVVNYAGNGFVEKSWDMIMDSNPMMIGDGKHMSARNSKTFADFFSKAKTVAPGSITYPGRKEK